ncbi:DUF1223 domain-containing protein [Mesorhizobium sp. A623]
MSLPIPKRAQVLYAAALIAISAGDAASAKMKPLTVVELFTSQGCSSCPPANANLVKLAGRPGVLALSFGVTYWDYLGWKDSFAKPEFTTRQISYEPSLGRSGPFTPQIVVDGTVDTVGNRLADIEALISRSHTGNKPLLSLAANKIRIGKGEAPGGKADVWLVRFQPGIVEVPIARGENTGRTLPHANVVQSLTKLGTWTGKAVVLPLPTARGSLRTAVLVQTPKGGPILAATTN